VVNVGKQHFLLLQYPKIKTQTQTHNLEFIFPLVKQFGSTKEHCRVGIVSAPVHFTINLALMLPVNKLLHHHSTSYQLPFSILYPRTKQKKKPPKKKKKKEKKALKNKSNKMGFWITHLLAKAGRPCLLEERQLEENPSRFGQQCRFWQLGICKGYQACRVLCG
jgi:hypothetical protein